MTRLYLTFFLLVGITMNSQTITEKYNSLMNRYEYYNSSGNMVGYKTYDSLMDTWNYYDVGKQTKAKSNNNYVQPINLQLVNKALSNKQSRYDYNVQRIQNAINQINENVYNSSYSADVINQSITDFNEKCLEVLNSKKYDYSSDSKTTEIINWMQSSMRNFVANNLQQEKEEEKQNVDKKVEEERKAAMGELSKFYGGYTTNLVTEEIYNKNSSGLYDIISEDKSSTKFFIQDSHLAFLRSQNNRWLGSAWVWFMTEPYLYLLFDNYNQLIAVSKDFKTITFYSDKVGNVYTKRYVYHNLKKDNTVKPN